MSRFFFPRLVLVSVLLAAPASNAATESQPAKKGSTEVPVVIQPGTAAKPTEGFQAPSLTYQTQQSGTPLNASNSFNRLLKTARRHQAPTDDGIHDPDNDGTKILQPPLEAYANLPRTASDLGNGVDWVKAMDEHIISPRWDIDDPEMQPLVMDMNIIRFPRGSIPNELFPHRQHTLWLDCSNCHPAIFIPQKGANQISMAANLLGQKCGTCHGKVSFPLSECKRCHSQPKVLPGREGVKP